MSVPWPGVHLFCLLVDGIRIFINEIYAHKKILLVNCQDTNQRLDLVLFPSFITLHAIHHDFDFDFLFFEGLWTEVVI